jgi:prolyl oligopeptidase
MLGVLSAAPDSPLEPITDILHGIPVTDSYRWLEDQESPRTREWIKQQTRHARNYLDSIPRRESIRRRIREFLAVETYDSLLKVGDTYFFRKRLAEEEQPCIYMRKGAQAVDELLVRPTDRASGHFTAVNPVRVSNDGRLLLYEVKEGGTKTGSFEILDVATGKVLPDVLPCGYLRGFAFAPDGKSFYYVHEPLVSKRPFYRAAYHHVIGTDFANDREIFWAGEDRTVRLSLISDACRLGFLKYHFLDKTYTDFYLLPYGDIEATACVLRGADYLFAPWLTDGRILAITDYQAPNLRIVEVNEDAGPQRKFVDLVPETDSQVRAWAVAGRRLYVGYMRQTESRVDIFDLKRKAEKTEEIRCRPFETIRLAGASSQGDEAFLEAESFTEPISLFRYSKGSSQRQLWARRPVHFEATSFGQRQVCYRSTDGTSIPMFLYGREDVLDGGPHPAIMTAYGGFGVAATPQFSVLVSYLVEHGCLFALPNIRGGAEFGEAWHAAAKRRNRQTAIDDFVSAAEWLVGSGRTSFHRLAIFGGSNSGLLVGAALTQRPDLFRAVVCMVPLLDMLRYHLFDNAYVWKDEFGTAEDAGDFDALLRYSPYHNVRAGTLYPATMIVAGGRDQQCNALHARKMTARLQAANVSDFPVLLDHSLPRGHCPVLPLTARIEALTDRVAFLCDQLELAS